MYPRSLLDFTYQCEISQIILLLEVYTYTWLYKLYKQCTHDFVMNQFVHIVNPVQSNYFEDIANRHNCGDMTILHMPHNDSSAQN